MQLVLKRLLRGVILLVLMIACGILVAGLAVAGSEYSKTHWVPERRWVWLSLFTLITFAAVAFEFRRKWFQMRFWVVLSGLLVCHVAGYALLLQVSPSWPLLMFAVVSIAETPVLCFIVDKVFLPPSGRQS